MTRTWLVIEFLLLFGALPLGFRFSPVRLPALPLLWVVAGYALWQLLIDPRFDRAKLWSMGQLPGRLGVILAIFAAAAFAIWFGVRRFAPQLEWTFVREHAAYWAVVMVVYPVLSVYPQGVIYRAFFFERYAGLFPANWAMIFASAVAFAFLPYRVSQLAGRWAHLCGRNTFRDALRGDRFTGDIELRTCALWLLFVHSGAGSVFLSRNHRDRECADAKVGLQQALR